MPDFLTCPSCGEAMVFPAKGHEWLVETPAECGNCDAKWIVRFPDPETIGEATAQFEPK